MVLDHTASLNPHLTLCNGNVRSRCMVICLRAVYRCLCDLKCMQVIVFLVEFMEYDVVILF